MRLVRLTLNGFKSFADKTEFTFDAPITGIVGPNGCGKSNVVDAIKWVLGERSAKSLRGKEMGDVIFAGSAGRKPMGLASVTLTFENPVIDPATRPAAARRRAEDAIEPDHEHDDGDEPRAAAEEPLFDVSPTSHGRALPIDTETVDIERRLHRDGTSEYLINGRKARLRDIRELFLDTGVGADAYSIIEQGKVDAMLLASPVERRTIFEEAAGVAKFRARRVEAQRKLERAEMNLVRAREQLESTERRLRIVKGQAAKARRFKELDEQLLNVRTALAFDQYHDLRRRLDGLTSRLRDLEETRREAAERLSSLEDDRQRAELERHELLTRKQEIEAERAGAEHARQKAEQRRELAHRAVEEAQGRLDAEDSRLNEARAAIERLREAIEERRSAADELERLVTDAEQRLQDAAQARSTAQTDLAGARATLDEKRAAALDVERKRESLLSEAEAERRRAGALRDQAARLNDRASHVQESAVALHVDLDAAAQSVARRETRVRDLEQNAATLDADLASLMGDQRSRSERLSEDEQELVRIESRRATLHEMIETRAGLGDAARAVLERREEGVQGYEMIVAPLAELVRTRADDAPAVEAALGRALQAIVVESLTDLASSPALNELTGRVAFVPLRGAAGGSPPPRASDALALPPHSLTPVRTLVDADERVRESVDRLLARTYVVDSLEQGAALASGPMSSLGARFVTRTGDVIEPDGRVFAGPVGGEESGRGLLQRRAELVELDTRSAGMRSRIEAQREELRRLDESAAAIDARRSELRNAVADERRAQAADGARRDRLTAEVARLERERVGVEEEQREIGARLDALETDRAELLARAERLDGLLGEQRAAADEAQRSVERLQSAVDEAAEALSHARVEASKHAEQLSQARRELRELEASIEDAERRAEHSAEQRRACEERLQSHRRSIAEAGAEIELAAKAHAAAEARLDAMQHEWTRAADHARERADQLNAAREHAHAVERDWQSLEITRRELEVRRETLEERTLEDISLDLSNAYGDWSTDAEAREPVDADALGAEADRLKEEIRRLGNVNLDAIEEEQQLETRNEDLARQVADIDAARASLEGLIERLNNASRDRFRETFQTIEANFAGKDGMFRKLFGGGKAELRLIPNAETGEVDWLESGVDVVAKPPGKEPRTIAQLSGGEKTMTAVALLMAIFQSKPSPFCVLDEVDAALDEANVGRFCTVVKQFLDRSHFIVITHNKRTMHEADLLYGVTMAERGVSRRVSVRFEDVGPAGQIRERAVAATPTDDTDDDETPASNGTSRYRAALASMRDEEESVGVE